MNGNEAASAGPPAPAPAREAIVFLTHLWHPAIAAHFERLRRQAGRPVFLLMSPFGADESQQNAPSGLAVTEADIAARFPARYASWRARGGGIRGYVDLVWLSAFLMPELGGFDRFWLIEYDLDFTGDWGGFFAAFADDPTDLVAAYVRRRSQWRGWVHWSTLVEPDPPTPDPLAALFPVSRFSRRFVDEARRRLAEPGWDGHFEAVLPTLALRCGLSVSDIGGHGDYVPADRYGRFYCGDWRHFDRGIATFGCDPSRGSRYSGGRAGALATPDTLYHPIKVGLPLRRRIDDGFVRWRRRAVSALGLERLRD